MALDERYIVASDLEQYFVDKDSGLPLAEGTLTFYRDSARSVPKQVYQLSGSPPNYTYTALPNPITLSSVGTVQNAGGDNEVIYYYPFDEDGNIDLYYIVCRDSNGIEQFSREAWPNIAASADPTENPFSVSNQISNPQFTRVLINQDQATTYTVSAATNQEFAFAPNWDFVISGTGTVTVQVFPIAGNDNVITSPPYVLDVNVSSGITSCFLRQRFNNNSGLWSSTGTSQLFLSATLVARNENIGSTGVQMYYEESSGGSPILILDGVFDNSEFVEIKGGSAAAIPESTNTDSGKSGYIDIYISFLPSSHVRVTSIQVIPTDSSAGTNFFSYEDQAANREQALMGDYYIPRLEQKPVASLLTAWDFPANPAQIGSSLNLSTTPLYGWDQTIGCRGNTGNVAVARSAVTGGMQFTTAGTNDAFYLMQYLDGAQAKKIIGTRLSANINAYKGSVGAAVTTRVYLFRAPAATAFPSLPSVIGSVATSGVFSLSAPGWTEIPRSGLDTATCTLSTVATNDELNNGNNDYGFSGWEIVDAAQIGDTDKFSMVVTFAYATAGTIITVNSISLVPGDLPCRPAAQSQDEVLRECQYYLEKSYDNGITAGSISNNGLQTSQQLTEFSVNTLSLRLSEFGIVYNTVKRVAPGPSNIAILSPTSGAQNMVYGVLYHNGSAITSGDISLANFSRVQSGTKSLQFVANTSAAALSFITGVSGVDFGYIDYHYVIDVRIGIA